MYEDIKNLEKKYSMHDFPLSIGIEPNNYCNFNCIMCAHDKMTRKKGSMDIRVYKKIIDEVADVNKNTRIYLDFYGEPLVNGYKLIYMIEYASSRGLHNININSNGSLLNEELAEVILTSGVGYLSFDCDGLSKEVYERIRVGGNRDLFYNNVEYILKRKKELGLEKPIIEIKVIEMKENADEIEGILNYWREKGAWTAKRRMHSWGGKNELANLGDNNSRIICGKAIGICAITWDGLVVNCPSDIDGTVVWGNVANESIKDIWIRRNETMVKKHFSHCFNELPEICQKCNDWQIIGEERFDQDGNPVNKNYKEDGNTFEERGVMKKND